MEVKPKMVPYFLAG